MEAEKKSTLAIRSGLDLGLTLLACAGIAYSAISTVWQAIVLGLSVFFLVRVTRAAILRRLPTPVLLCPACGAK